VELVVLESNLLLLVLVFLGLEVDLVAVQLTLNQVAKAAEVAQELTMLMEVLDLAVPMASQILVEAEEEADLLLGLMTDGQEAQE
jgi:predicted subunit of tRNA(5-methylaminomethyl-2-thiouridylate) methyltransferase